MHNLVHMEDEGYAKAWLKISLPSTSFVSARVQVCSSLVSDHSQQICRLEDALRLKSSLRLVTLTEAVTRSGPCASPHVMRRWLSGRRLLQQREKTIILGLSALLVANLLVLRVNLGDMATAQTTQEEVRKGLSKLGFAGKSMKHLPEHAQDPTQPGNPNTKRTDQIFAEEIGRTSMLWSPFLNRGADLALQR